MNPGKISAVFLLVICLADAGHSQNLIVNGDFRAGNTGFSTGYGFVTSGESVTPGTFGIRTNSQDFNPNYSTFVDPAGDGGPMLLLDGYAPGTPAWSETINVSPNKNYLFSGWATPSDPPNAAVLQFEINGAQIGGQYPLTSTIAWTNFSNIWFSGANTQATLSISDENTSYEAAGDDFALDDLSFGLFPELTIHLASHQAVLSWPTNNNYSLQSTTNLLSAWSAVTNVPVATNGQFIVTNLLARPQKFYRLSQ